MKNHKILNFIACIILLLSQVKVVAQCLTCNSSDTLNYGLIACFPFNGNSKDFSSNNNDGVVSSAILTFDRFGLPNSAYKFNGGSNKITLAHSSSLDISTTKNISFATWVYPTITPSLNSRIINYGSIYGKVYEINLLDKVNNGADSGKVQFYNFSQNALPSASVINIHSNTQIPLNKWTFIVVTIDGNIGSTKLYINGVLEASSNIMPIIPTSTLSNSPIVTIGNHNPIPWGFTGTIDDVRIYNKILTISEVTKLYSGIPQSFKPLITRISDSLMSNYAVGNQWYLNNILIPGAVNQFYTPISSGSYSVDLTINGCNSLKSDSISIFLKNDQSNCVSCISIDSLNYGLIACYPFSGNEFDNTSYSNHGKTFGATLIPDRFNNSNSAYNFNGLTNKITVDYDTSLDISTNKNISFSVWVYPKIVPSLNSRIINFGSIYGKVYEINYLDNINNGGDSGKVQFYNFSQNASPTASVIDIHSITKLTLNKWSFITVTIDGNLGKTFLYINGNLEASSNKMPVIPTSSVTNSPIITIGSHNPIPWGFIGGIDDIRIYKRILTVNEVNQLYYNQNPNIIPIITKIGNTLKSNSSQGNQWYFNNSIINGADSQTYTPISSGIYSVVVTNNGCASASSDSFDFSLTGFEMNKEFLIDIFPNPSKKTFYLNFNEKIKLMEVYNILGEKVISKENFIEKSIDLSELNSSTYFLKIYTNTHIYTKQLYLIKN